MALRQLLGVRHSNSIDGMERDELNQALCIDVGTDKVSHTHTFDRIDRMDFSITSLYRERNEGNRSQ